MTYVDLIVDRFGGAKVLARDLGYPVSTVRSWVARGSIHDDHKPAVLTAAHARGLSIGPADFFPLPVAVPQGTAA